MRTTMNISNRLPDIDQIIFPWNSERGGCSIGWVWQNIQEPLTLSRVLGTHFDQDYTFLHMFQIITLTLYYPNCQKNLWVSGSWFFCQAKPGLQIGSIGWVCNIQEPLTLSRVLGTHFHQGDTMRTAMNISNRLPDIDQIIFLWNSERGEGSQHWLGLTEYSRTTDFFFFEIQVA